MQPLWNIFSMEVSQKWNYCMVEQPYRRLYMQRKWKQGFAKISAPLCSLWHYSQLPRHGISRCCQQMNVSTDEWIKEMYVVWVLLSHEKRVTHHLWKHGETLRASLSVKSDRESQILHDTTHMWNLKSWTTRSQE